MQKFKCNNWKFFNFYQPGNLDYILGKEEKEDQMTNPRSLSSMVKSLISIPHSLIAAIVSGSSSAVTSNSFSSDSAALLKAYTLQQLN